MSAANVCTLCTMSAYMEAFYIFVKAHFCKLLRYFHFIDDTGETITIRGCALDSGTLTTDTELIRMSHCGRFYYDDR